MTAITPARGDATVDPTEDMTIVIMGQVLPNDDDLPRKVQTLVYAPQR